MDKWEYLCESAKMYYPNKNVFLREARQAWEVIKKQEKQVENLGKKIDEGCKHCQGLGYYGWT